VGARHPCRGESAAGGRGCRPGNPATRVRGPGRQRQGRRSWANEAGGGGARRPTASWAATQAPLMSDSDTVKGRSRAARASGTVKLHHGGCRPGRPHGKREDDSSPVRPPKPRAVVVRAQQRDAALRASTGATVVAPEAGGTRTTNEPRTAHRTRTDEQRLRRIGNRTVMRMKAREKEERGAVWYHGCRGKERTSPS